MLAHALSKVLNLSPQQSAIMAMIPILKRNLIIKATAGSGKTTTLEQICKHIPTGKSVLYLAFGKKIATELQSRGLPASTFNALGWGALSKAMRFPKLEADKLRDVIDAVCGDVAPIYGQFLLKLVKLGKNAGIAATCDDLPQAWIDLANHHELELESESADFATAIGYASKVLAASTKWRTVDFDDQLYLPVKLGLSLPKYDFLLIDETQDTNAIQRALIRKLMHADSRLIAVGDRYQSIYAFRGADSTAMDLIESEFNCHSMPLSVSYRCSKSVVKYAQQFCPTIEHAPNAIEGSVVNLGQKYDVNDFTSSDMVVCRTTAPLITLAYQCLKARKPVKIEGRDIGTGLKSLVGKMKAKGIDALQTKLAEWTSREKEKAIAKRDDARAEAIQDKTDCVMFLIQELDENNRTIPALLAVIDSLFSDKANATTLCTIHKSKGLESRRVFWLNRSKCPATWARQPWQIEQELNICFVATTRAMVDLVIIEEKK